MKQQQQVLFMSKSPKKQNVTVSGIRTQFGLKGVWAEKKSRVAYQHELSNMRSTLQHIPLYTKYIVYNKPDAWMGAICAPEKQGLTGNT